MPSRVVLKALPDGKFVSVNPSWRTVKAFFSRMLNDPAEVLLHRNIVALASNHEGLRAKGIEGLCDLKRVEATFYLAPLLSDSAVSDFLKEKIVQTIEDVAAEIRSAKGRPNPLSWAVKHLVEAYESSSTPLRRRIATALGVIGQGNSRAVNFLEAVVEQERDLFAVAYAARSLGEVGGKDSVTTLLDALSPERSLTEMALVEVLHALEKTAKRNDIDCAADILEKVMSIDNMVVRMEAFLVIGRIGTVKTIEALKNAKGTEQNATVAETIAVAIRIVSSRVSTP